MDEFKNIFLLYREMNTGTENIIFNFEFYET